MNHVTLIGRIANDLEIRYTTSQMAVLKFNLAIQRLKKEDGADFPRITVFGKQAENTERFCRKGNLIAVAGRLQTGSYKDKDGKTVYTTDVIASNVEFLSWNNEQREEPDISPEIPEVEFAMLDEEVPF